MQKMNPDLVLGKVAVTSDHPAASGSTTGPRLFASAEIASDAGDLSAFADADAVTSSESSVAANVTDNRLATFIENCATTTAEILKTDLSSAGKLSMPASAEAIFAGNGCHEIAVRLLSSAEMSELNRDYRGKDGSTNVLSFPALDDAELLEAGQQVPDWCAPLGDIAICTDVVTEEARQQGKPATAHLAHMVVHGMLHLLGYDHLSEQEAGIMETTESRVLAGLGFKDPYIAVQHEVAKKNS